MSEQWQSPLFGCCDKGLIDCLTGWFCSCYVGGVTTGRLEGGSWVVPCLLYILCRPCYALHRRQAVRTAYKIEGSCCGDCCTCCFCHVCAILQESHEVDKRGNPSGPVGQSMS